jgi:hypothetical protein
MPARTPFVRAVVPATLAILIGLLPRPAAAAGTSVRSILRDQPLAFVPNRGQADPEAQFVARGDGYALALAPTQALLSLQGAERNAVLSLRMKVLGGNRAAQPATVSPLPGQSHYLVGNDPAAWRTGLPRYGAVRYDGIYRGVDLVYHGADERQVEYDFVVAPGTSPKVVRLRFEGVSGLSLDGAGNLVLHAPGGDVTWKAPVAYQEVRGARHEVGARYVLGNKGEVGFKVARYDGRRPLVIDPVLVYATYLRGNASDRASAIAVDGAGNAYVTGTTCSFDFPTAGPAQGGLGGGCDAFVTKLSPAGALVYSTYLGGAEEERGYGIGVDAAGRAHVVGQTFSSDFPTKNAAQGSLGGLADAFVAKLSAAGDSFVYSTYLGGSVGQFGFFGSECGYALAMDGAGNAYVTGFTDSSDFPTVNPLQATRRGPADAFVTKLAPEGGLVYSTYLSVAPLSQVGVNTIGHAIAVDVSGAAYAAGETTEADGLAGGGGPDSASGVFDAFVAKLSPGGNALVYSSLFGGITEDSALAVAVDGAGRAVVAGYTFSADFPIASPLQGALSGISDAFVARLSTDGSTLLYSTYLGGSDADQAFGVALDAAGNAYVTGATASEDFPTVDAFQGTKASVSDAFLTEISADGSALVYSTYYGDPDPAHSLFEAGSGVAVDGSGNAYVAGTVDEPPGPDAPRTAPVGGTDAFVIKVGGAPQNQPPSCTAAAAAPAVLWSPDPRLVPIAITGVTDPEGDPVVLAVGAITQDEPVLDNGTGTGHTCPDAIGVGTGAPSVRAERAGTRAVPGDGRVYHIAFTATDPSGASCQGVATVCVPHDSASSSCIDEGALYDSAACP